MKKLLGILVLGLLWCNPSFADLTLYCKQEVRINTVNGVTETMPMPENWVILITETQIHVVGFEILYPDLMRKKEKESGTIYYGDNDRSVIRNTITIDRITGEGRISEISGNSISREILKCSNKKPKLLF